MPNFFGLAEDALEWLEALWREDLPVKIYDSKLLSQPACIIIISILLYDEDLLYLYVASFLQNRHVFST